MLSFWLQDCSLAFLPVKGLESRQSSTRQVLFLFWFFFNVPHNDEKFPPSNGVLIVLLGNPQYPYGLHCFESAS